MKNDYYEIVDPDAPINENINYLIEDFLPEKGTGIMLGASTVGKTAACLPIKANDI